MLPATECINNEVLTLGYILRNGHFGNSVAKGELIASIMDGKIKPVGRIGGQIQDIILQKSDSAAFWKKTRFIAEGKTFSPAEAATHLHCDPTILGALIKEGSLQAIQVPAGIRLTEKSVMEFGTKFVSVAKLAKKIGTSSRKLQRELLKRDIQFTKYERGYGKSDQAFVSAMDEARLDEIFQTMRSAPQIPVRPSAITALKQFLTNLKETGAPLPRRGGKPNKRAIAKACGFDRNMLYTNFEAVKLLNLYDTED